MQIGQLMQQYQPQPPFQPPPIQYEIPVDGKRRDLVPLYNSVLRMYNSTLQGTWKTFLFQGLLGIATFVAMIVYIATLDSDSGFKLSMGFIYSVLIGIVVIGMIMSREYDRAVNQTENGAACKQYLNPYINWNALYAKITFPVIVLLLDLAFFIAMLSPAPSTVTKPDILNGSILYILLATVTYFITHTILLAFDAEIYKQLVNSINS